MVAGAAALVMLAGATPSTQAVNLIDPLGAALWHVGGEGRGTPAADQSTVFFLSKRHEVLAVSAGSGAVRWRSHTNERTEATEGERVVLAGSVVLAGDYALHAFDRRSGARRWKFEPGDGGYDVGSYLGPAGLNLVFAGGRGGRVYALEPETGRVRWSTIVYDGPRLSTVFDPVLADDLLAASYTVFSAPNEGGVVALDAATGARRWQASFPRPADPALHANAGSRPAVTDGLVIVTRGDGVIHAFDRGTGAMVWTLPKVDGPTLVPFTQDSRPLAFAGPLLVAGSASGVVTAYDLPSRRQRWRYDGRSGSVAFALVADESSVYVPHVGGRLIALSSRTGTERWRIGNNASGFVWPPALFDGRLYVAGAGAGFYALHR